MTTNMSSNYFSISPERGTGITEVAVSVNGTNYGATDKAATLTVTDGVEERAVTLKQRYCPFLTNQSGTLRFPSYGGTIYFRCSTEYDIVFLSIPEWLTVKRDNTTYASGDRISAGTASGSTFAITASRNLGFMRSTHNTFCMKHYLADGTLGPNITYINLTQETSEIPVNYVDYECTYYDLEYQEEVDMGLTIVSEWRTDDITINFISEGIGEETDDGMTTCQAYTGGTISITLRNIYSTEALDFTLSYNSVYTNEVLDVGETVTINATYARGEKIYIVVSKVA